ncbi:MAG TPA: hypothetical protein VMC84_13510 [Methanocella sp.]|uniref:hypothetical protein n=1 Tax=Methanocella sp. TaxID=2052833 RepID=UPI002CD3CECC|nr:hypothetical protein [Methanocella sp.]HTY92187.1 hypothetical protein [Methanocella sp.]
MKATKFAKYSLQIIIVGMLLLAFLPIAPASALHNNVIGIVDSETINWVATYQPNSDGSNGAQPAGTVSGNGVITITNNGPITLNDVAIVFNAGSTTASSWTLGTSTATATITPGSGIVTVNVKAFAPGTNVVVNYPIPSGLTSPITFTTTYSQNRITDSTSSFVDVTLTANANGVAVNPTITITPADSTTHGTPGTPDWTLTSSSSGVSKSGNNLIWTPGSISAGSNSQIVFRATVLDTGALDDGSNQIALFDMATSSVTYTLTSNTQSVAGVGVNSVTGMTTEVSSKIDKQQLNGQWVFTPAVSVPSSGTDLSYELDSVSEWAVQTDLTTSLGTNTISSSHNNGETWPAIFDKTTGWTGAGANELLQFAYNGIPVGFMKPTMKVYDDPSHTQFPRSYSDGSGTVTLLKKIYVISGYDVQVTKTITPVSGNEYLITITAQNIGTKITPAHVYVYDIVPSAFYSTASPVSPFSFSDMPTGPTGVTGGEAYYWDLGQLAAYGNSGDTKVITYHVLGSGTYTAADLYVVGVDPAQSLNLQTTPILQNMSTMANANFESLAALGAAGLLVIGMVGTARRKQ